MKKDIDTFDLPQDFFVGKIEGKEKIDAYSDTPIKVSAGFFILCMRGSVRVSLNTTSHVLKPKDFVILVPGSFIHIHEVSDDVELMYVGFSAEFLSHLNLVRDTAHFLPLMVEQPVHTLDDPIHMLCQDTLDLLNRSFPFLNTLNNKNLIRSILVIFIQVSAELYKNKCHRPYDTNTRMTELYNDFVALVIRYHSTQHSVSFYAKQLGVSLPHFCTSIKKATGFTPGDVITYALMMNAKGLLQYTNKSIKEIAFSLGFTNLSFFNKYFRQHSQMTPQEYRRSKTGIPVKKK
ncbi:MAG: helix-turn-helix domain-containing protein [Parabacteroides sp.]